MFSLVELTVVLPERPGDCPVIYCSSHCTVSVSGSGGWKGLVCEVLGLGSFVFFETVAGGWYGLS